MVPTSEGPVDKAPVALSTLLALVAVTFRFNVAEWTSGEPVELGKALGSFS